MEKIKYIYRAYRYKYLIDPAEINFIIQHLRKGDIGVDIGAAAKITDDMTVGFSITNLISGISWYQNNKVYRYNYEMNGIFINQLENIEEELDLETQIENAVEELSDEDLESELDEETLLEIATSEMGAFDSLNSRDLKLAIGEEVESDEAEIENLEETQPEAQEVENESEDIQTNTIEALENLLAALKDKNVVASMKGMKININITIGEE